MLITNWGYIFFIFHYNVAPLLWIIVQINLVLTHNIVHTTIYYVGK